MFGRREPEKPQTSKAPVSFNLLEMIVENMPVDAETGVPLYGNQEVLGKRLTYLRGLIDVALFNQAMQNLAVTTEPFTQGGLAHTLDLMLKYEKAINRLSDYEKRNTYGAMGK